MAPNPLRDLLGRRDGPPPELAAALADLDRLGRERPELSSPARTLARALRAAFLPVAKRIEGDGFPGRDRDAIRRSWAEGVPAFHRACPPLESPTDATARVAALCRALRPDNPSAAALLRAIRRGAVPLPAWIDAARTGDLGPVGREAQAARIDPELAASVLRLAVLPVLSLASQALDPLRPEGAWPRGDCPHCGGRPLLAESRGLDARRFLRCGLCAASWPFETLRCPACGEADHRALRTLSVAGEEARRHLARCDTCGFALKVVSTLGPLAAPALVVADLETIHLDLIAERGITEENDAP